MTIQTELSAELAGTILDICVTLGIGVLVINAVDRMTTKLTAVLAALEGGRFYRPDQRAPDTVRPTPDGGWERIR